MSPGQSVSSSITISPESDVFPDIVEQTVVREQKLKQKMESFEKKLELLEATVKEQAMVHQVYLHLLV